MNIAINYYLKKTLVSLHHFPDPDFVEILVNYSPRPSDISQS
jgi:hypothetical protein